VGNDILITGGAGFIGVNTAAYYLSRGRTVVVWDNFSRVGSEANAQWLRATFGERVSVLRGDVRMLDHRFHEAVERSAAVFHLAAQVAVTTSVTGPREDFEVNALGTFNVLESVRMSRARPVMIYASTNKVYGKMSSVRVEDRGSRYAYVDLPQGVPEEFPLDFYSPYGCSKGAGDQYVIDYARIFGLRTVCFRQSCIYGPHQFGVEDQGWLAWFAIRALQGKPVTIFGDGKQVRDVLYVDDLVRAYDAALTQIDRTSGRAYNIGGGPQKTLSLLELIAMLDARTGRRMRYDLDDWRPGDQRVYVSDIRRAATDFGWEPRTLPAEGVSLLCDWLMTQRQLFDSAA
jgi:CDP-paratose 2-epimerase